MDRLPDDRSAEELVRLAEEYAAFVETSYSPLLGVVGVGETVRVSGLRVELIAVEIREKGAVIHLRAFGDEDGMRDAAVVTVTDDLGSTYQVAMTQGGGGGRAWSGEYNVVPRPGPSARRLLITVERFDTFQGFDTLPELQAHAIAAGVWALPAAEGPWAFDVAL